MSTFYKAPQSVFQNMGVDLGGRDIGVAEKLLNRAQVGTVLEKVTGKGVAQHVGRCFGGIKAGAGAK